MTLDGLAAGLNQKALIENPGPQPGLLATLTSALDVAPGVETLNFKENEFVFRQGDLANGFYFLKSGAIKIGRKPTVTRGRASSVSFISRMVGAGEFFGYKSLIAGGPRDFFAKTGQASQILFYSKDAFASIFNGSTPLFRQVLTQAIHDLVKYEDLTHVNYLASVEERIAHQLVNLADKFGVTSEDGISLSLRLTRNEMAQLAGTINESLSRHLTALKNEGLIDLRGREILIKNRDALAKLSGSF